MPVTFRVEILGVFKTMLFKIKYSYFNTLLFVFACLNFNLSYFSQCRALQSVVFCKLLLYLHDLISSINTRIVWGESRCSYQTSGIDCIGVSLAEGGRRAPGAWRQMPAGRLQLVSTYTLATINHKYYPYHTNNKIQNQPTTWSRSYAPYVTNDSGSTLMLLAMRLE